MKPQSCLSPSITHTRTHVGQDGAAVQQRQQGGPQPQGGLFPGKTHMRNDSSHGQQEDHPHQTQQQGATAQHSTTLATAVWGQQ